MAVGPGPKATLGQQHVRRQVRLGAGDALLAGLLVRHGQQPPDPAGDRVLEIAVTPVAVVQILKRLAVARAATDVWQQHRVAALGQVLRQRVERVSVPACAKERVLRIPARAPFRVDATAKGPDEGAREWPTEIVMTDDVKARVDARWAELGLPEHDDRRAVQNGRRAAAGRWRARRVPR